MRGILLDWRIRYEEWMLRLEEHLGIDPVDVSMGLEDLMARKEKEKTK